MNDKQETAPIACPHCGHVHQFPWPLRFTHGNAACEQCGGRFKYEQAEGGPITIEPTEAPPELWCVHVIGPDTVIAQPDKRTAAQRAALWNETISKRETQPGDPHIECKVIPWPNSAAQHALTLSQHGGQPDDIC